MPATTSRFIILPNGDAIHPDDVRGVSTMSELDGTHAVCVTNAHGASPVVGSFPTREAAEQARDDLIAQVDARAVGRGREEQLAAATLFRASHGHSRVAPSVAAKAAEPLTTVMHEEPPGGIEWDPRRLRVCPEKPRHRGSRYWGELHWSAP